jgi:hypothetical protein
MILFSILTPCGFVGWEDVSKERDAFVFVVKEL